MLMAKRRQLQDWQVEDAARLKAIFDRYSAEHRISQEKFGEESRIGSQGLVWQYLSGTIPLNHDALTKFSNALGVHASAISPTLWDQIDFFYTSQIPKEKGEEAKSLSQAAPTKAQEKLLNVIQAIQPEARDVLLKMASLLPKDEKKIGGRRIGGERRQRENTVKEERRHIPLTRKEGNNG